jgi:maltodextrin utilization protein YvdJ
MSQSRASRKEVDRRPSGMSSSKRESSDAGSGGESKSDDDDDDEDDEDAINFKQDEMIVSKEIILCKLIYLFS